MVAKRFLKMFIELCAKTKREPTALEPSLWELRRTKRNIFREVIEEDESHTNNKHVKKFDSDDFDMLGGGSHCKPLKKTNRCMNESRNATLNEHVASNFYNFLIPDRYVGEEQKEVSRCRCLP